MNSIHTNFYKLPIKIYELGLSSNELAVLTYLFSLSGYRRVHPSRETIASKIGLSKRTVDKAIKLLVKKGFLEYDRGYIKGDLKVCNRYRVRIEKIDSACMVKSKKQVEKELPSESQCNEMIMESIQEYGK